MLRRILLPTLAVAAAFLVGSNCSANDGFAYSAFGLGIYQPYGIRYSTSVRTPPYFAVNPPVYYGQRHYRPYGASPFASLPLVQAGNGYRTRAAGESASPSLSVPHPSAAHLNPFCKTENAESIGPKVVSVEQVERRDAIVKTNPYAGSQVALGQVEANTAAAMSGR